MFRWIFYDLEWKEDDGRKVSKLVLVGYSPDANPDATSKFVIPNSLGAIKTKCPEINLDKTINNHDDFTDENIRSWFK